MFGKLDIFRMAGSMAVHAGTRQAAIAQNVANADTPGYKTRDIAPFSDIVKTRQAPSGLRATREGHLMGSQDAFQPEFQVEEVQSDSPNGNAVSIEMEMLKAVETQRQHEKSVAIYRSALAIMRTSLGRT